MNESNLMRRLMVAIGNKATIFRNHVGFVVDQRGQGHHFGLTKGSSDLIGWTTRIVSADMIGKKVAIFTAIEVKTSNGRLTPEQTQFLTRVQEAGGIGIVAKCPEDLAPLSQNIPENPNLSLLS